MEFLNHIVKEHVSEYIFPGNLSGFIAGKDFFFVFLLSVDN